MAGHSVKRPPGGDDAGLRLERLAAPDLPDDLVRNALSISGLLNWNPFAARLSCRSLRLTPDAIKASPAWMPRPHMAVCSSSVCGGDERAEFLRQTS
ncbi:MAG: hypothetical protein H6930_14550 [Rhodoferax sp.]|nr:hypothetical protein [Rhodoferax sp.]